MVTILRGGLGTPLVLLNITQKKFIESIAGAIILSGKDVIMLANITINYKDLRNDDSTSQKPWFSILKIPRPTNVVKVL